MCVPHIGSSRTHFRFQTSFPMLGPSSNRVGGAGGTEDDRLDPWHGQPALVPTPKGQSPAAESEPASEQQAWATTRANQADTAL